MERWRDRVKEGGREGGREREEHFHAKLVEMVILVYLWCEGQHDTRVNTV